MSDDRDDYPEDPPNPREHVEHPIAVAERASRRDPVFHAALVEAMADHEPTAWRGMLRMMALTLDAGEGAPAFRAIPAHLPDDESGQRLLMSSTAASDAGLRGDLIDWAHDNKRAGEPAAKTLENAIIGYRRGQRLVYATHEAAAKVAPARQAHADALQAVTVMEDGETWDRDEMAKAVAYAHACEKRLEVAIEASTPDPVVTDALATIGGWLWTTWGVKPDGAPDTPRALEAWAIGIVGRANPTPEWLITGQPSRSAFVPSARHMGPRSAKAVIG